MRIVDLFSGLGGMTIGCIQAAKELNVPLEIAFSCDYALSCNKFYMQNFKSHLLQYYSKSILELETREIKYSNNIDYLFAGPPCQGHSDLNNSSRREDPRNLLYLETIELIGFFNPSVFVIENVPTVIHSKEKVVKQLSIALGSSYNIEEYVVDFLNLGIAQTRKRHILIGRKSSFPLLDIEKFYSTEAKKNLKDAIGDLVDVDSDLLIDKASKMMPHNKERVEYLFKNNLYDLPNYLRPKCHQSEHSYKSMYGRLDWMKPAQTITGGFGSMGQGRFIHPSEKRVITPHEAARIQGLPDSLDYSMLTKRGDIQQMIGNAVPPILSKKIILEMEGSSD